MKCAECPEYNECSKKYNLTIRRRRCPKAKEEKVVTNADRIRAMSDEELAELLAEETYRMAKPIFDYLGYGIEKQVVYARRLKWIKQPVED